MVGENGNVWPFMYFSLIHHLLPLNFRMAEKEFLGDRREGLRCGQNVMLGINQAFFNVFLPPHVPGFVEKLNLVQNSLRLTKVSLRFFEFDRNCQLYCTIFSLNKPGFFGRSKQNIRILFFCKLANLPSQIKSPTKISLE